MEKLKSSFGSLEDRIEGKILSVINPGSGFGTSKPPYIGFNYLHKDKNGMPRESYFQLRECFSYCNAKPGDRILIYKSQVLVEIEIRSRLLDRLKMGYQGPLTNLSDGTIILIDYIGKND